MEVLACAEREIKEIKGKHAGKEVNLCLITDNLSAEIILTIPLKKGPQTC
jgi:hypothetical protein